LGCGLWAELIEGEGDGFDSFDDIEGRDLQNDAGCSIYFRIYVIPGIYFSL